MNVPSTQKITKEENDEDQKLPSSTFILITWIIQVLHLVYGGGIIFTISQLQSRTNTNISTLLTLLIGLPLVVDNFRYTGIPLPSSIAMYASKFCFYAHEVFTPLGLLYIPLIFVDYVPYHEMKIWLFPMVLLVSVFFVYLGWRRYQAMDGWKMTTTYGIKVCRPNHTLHAALIPIFMQVIGIIICSGCVCYKEQYQGRQPILILFISQMIVFFGNGAIGPNKLLMSMFGNAFEVLWLWSLVQATK